MSRILFFLVLAALACRLFTGRWPWQFLQSGTTRSQALSRARRLLGVRANASRHEIVEAHRRLTGLVHPDRGGSTSAMQEANAARDLLLAELTHEG